MDKVQGSSNSNYKHYKVTTVVTLTEVENVPSEEVAFAEAWVDCDEVAQVWV
jgi:hypothetical protein